MQSYREDGKVKKRTIANLSHLPDDCIELIRGSLAGEQYVKAQDLKSNALFRMAMSKRSWR
jgi:hypothetical protein